MKFSSIFVIAMFAVCSSANGQLNQYAEFQRAIVSQRSSAAYLENIADKARSPNVPYTATGIDRSLFYTKQVSNPYALTDKQKQDLEVWKQNEKKEADRRSEIMDSWRAGKAPFISKFELVGFSSMEADRVAAKMVDSYGHQRPDSAIIGRIADYKLYFDSKKETASFDELMLTISGYESYAPGTAFYDLRFLRGRFADRAAQLEVAEVTNLLQYFKTIAFLDSRDKFTMGLIDEYFKVAQAYPEIENDFISKVHSGRQLGFDPYEIMIFYCSHVYLTDKKEMSRLKKLHAELVKKYSKLGY